MSPTRLILGVDPGLRHTGWGVVAITGHHLKALGCGVVSPDDKAPMAERLAAIHEGLSAVIAQHGPHEAAIEETFVNANATSTLKLGFARGAAFAALGLGGLSVAEYAASTIKKSVAGYGAADKAQMKTIISMLLPGVDLPRADAADALAVAICHAHRAATSLLTQQARA